MTRVPMSELVWDDGFSDEAMADAAPVAADLAYRPRQAWKPGNCLGFIINTSNPVARLEWPKRGAAKEFFARIQDAAAAPR
jgi:hypothetical protein